MNFANFLVCKSAEELLERTSDLVQAECEGSPFAAGGWHAIPKEYNIWLQDPATVGTRRHNESLSCMQVHQLSGTGRDSRHRSKAMHAPIKTLSKPVRPHSLCQ